MTNDANIAQSAWISVKDRLPSEEGYYLLCSYDEVENGNKKIDIYIDTFKHYWIEEEISENERRSYRSEKLCFDPLWNVTHWMPLPAPPET